MMLLCEDPYGRDGICAVIGCDNAVTAHVVVKWNGAYGEGCGTCAIHAKEIEHEYQIFATHVATGACFQWGRATYYPQFNFCLIDEEYRAEEEKIGTGQEVKSPMKVSSHAPSNPSA